MSDVTGQDNAAIDVPNVQQAVDAGGTVFLHGNFSFVNARLPAPLGSSVILVTGPVVIRGQNATIRGGGSATPAGMQAVLFIDAPGADVTIEGLRFVNPHNAAIRVRRSGNLRIAGCQVDGVTPSDVATPAGFQHAALAIHFPGGPCGAVSIVDNRIQTGGTDDQSIGGIIMTGPADRLTISDNRISGTTSHGIDLRDIAGPATIERNVIATGTAGRSGLPGQFVDALRLIGSGAYVVERNQFDCGFENAAVVRLGGTKDALIKQNEVVASVPINEVPGLQSAGVQVQGSAEHNDILQNRINGRARVAISTIFSEFPLDKANGTGNPSETTFRGNNVEQFAATLATVEVGAGAANTTIVGGSGTLIDHGTGTVVQGNFHPPA